MLSKPAEPAMQRRMVDSLYVEAMLLADESRAYFEETGRQEREALLPILRVAFSCESLRVTTRLMHVIAWLLTQRAVAAGEMRADQALDPSRRLGDAPTTDADTLLDLPPRARALVEASIDLHRRVGRFDRWQADGGRPAASVANPVHGMLDQLTRSI
jgi:regulator of CtrA degradation